MVASELTELNKSNILRGSEDVLSVAGIFGANSSGKSNIIKAIAFMRFFILNSFGAKSFSSNIPIEHFAYSTEIDKNSPSEFGIVFSNESTDDIYEYRFSINYKNILSEELSINDEWVFYRKEDHIKSNPKKVHDFKIKQRMTRSDVLYLSVLAATNSDIATNVVDFFQNNITVISGMNPEISRDTKEMINNKKYSKMMMQAIHEADLYIDDLSLEKSQYRVETILGNEKIPKEILDQVENESFRIKSRHKIYSTNDKPVDTYEDYMDNIESVGTHEFLAIIGPIIKALVDGSVLFIDEMGATLHPLMSQYIIKQFMLPNNKNKGQLIFNSHDTNLLDNKLLRRDQIWFTDKDSTECTSLVPMDSYVHNGKRIRSDVNYSKRYLSGKFGAIPIFPKNKFSHVSEKTNGEV